MRAQTANWLLSADYDFRTATALLKSRRYIYVIFMCHLSLEKTLKAALSEKFGEMPPYTHNLNRLIEMSGLLLPKEHQDFVDRLSLKSVPTRYPEDFRRLSKEFNREIAEEYCDRQGG